ncbi:hypothetical protein SESBI_15827 [Sesbania bispinosa]|nr:hypothetical protein SESBI_15827 [Sesbania bispinosa]
MDNPLSSSHLDSELEGVELILEADSEIIAKAWGLQEELKISDMGPNVFLFNFARANDTVKVLNEGPWFVMGHLLSLQHWIPEASVFEVNYDWKAHWWMESFSDHLFDFELKLTSENPSLLAFESLGKTCPEFGFGASLGVPKPKSLATIVTENSSRASKLRKKEGGEEPQGQQQPERRTNPSTTMQPTYNTTVSANVWGTYGTESHENLSGVRWQNVGGAAMGPHHTRSEKIPEQPQGEIPKPPFANNMAPNTSSSFESLPGSFVRRVHKNLILVQAHHDAVPHIYTPNPNLDFPGMTAFTPQALLSQAQTPTPIEFQSSKPSHQPTKVDVLSGLYRAGLGPNHLDDLDLTKEFIGLQKEVVTVDYPNPNVNGDSKYGISLSQDEINKCKSTLSSLAESHTGQSCSRRTWVVQELNDEDAQVYTSEKDYIYKVEFPPDGLDSSPSKNKEMVSALSVGFQRMVSLKRQRESFETEDHPMQEDFPTKKNKFILPEISTTMAEEAGLIKPPPPS